MQHVTVAHIPRADDDEQERGCIAPKFALLAGQPWPPLPRVRLSANRLARRRCYCAPLSHSHDRALVPAMAATTIYLEPMAIHPSKASHGRGPGSKGGGGQQRVSKQEHTVHKFLNLSMGTPTTVIPLQRPAGCSGEPGRPGGTQVRSPKGE
eukprot:6189938-Pleurochrysis_carterae.AAC.1